MAASQTNPAYVMHIDMDAFFASVEQRVNPSLRGRPVIVGGRPDKNHSIVCAASYEAKARGVSNAMTTAYALRLCPEAVFVPADTAKYVDASRRIEAILEEMFPCRVERFSIDEFFVLMPPQAVSLHDIAAVSQAVKQRIREELGLTCSIGVAPTRVMAKLASKAGKPDGLTLWDHKKAAAVLRDLPVEKLCGIGERWRRRLDALGVRTCGQLAVFPSVVLQKRFGVMGLWLQAACRLEEDAGGLCVWHKKEEAVKSVGHSQTLYAATDDIRRIHAWLYLLCEMVARRLRRLNRLARTVWVYLSDGFDGGVGRQRTYAAATDDGHELFRRAVSLFSEMPRPPRVRVLAVSASGLTDEVQDSLFGETVRRRRLIQAMDRLNQRWGEWCVYPAQLQQATYGRP